MSLDSEVNVLRWIDVHLACLQALRRSQGGKDEILIVVCSRGVSDEFLAQGDRIGVVGSDLLRS